MGRRYEHAIVIGGSIAGLCAARVLSDFSDRVTIFERDDLPTTPPTGWRFRRADMCTC
jgi:2-polyprenyl-6-methoxyphenol hydroxylase-like FAD-dependent oxidoreductase